MNPGRPTKYNSEYNQQIIDFMSEGNSIAAFAAEIGVARDTLYSWAKSLPEFKYSLEIAKAKSEAWWEAEGRKGLFTRGFNASVWIFTMKSRFKWRENALIVEEAKIPQKAYDFSKMTKEEYREHVTKVLTKQLNRNISL